MAKSTASTKVRRRSAGEGTVYPFRGGHRGAITWTDPDGTRHRRTVSGAPPTRPAASSTISAATSASGRWPRPGRRSPSATTSPAGSNATGRASARRLGEAARSHVRVYLDPGARPDRAGPPDRSRRGARPVGLPRTGRPDRPAKRTRGRQNAAGISPLDSPPHPHDPPPGARRCRPGRAGRVATRPPSRGRRTSRIGRSPTCRRGSWPAARRDAGRRIRPALRPRGDDRAPPRRVARPRLGRRGRRAPDASVARWPGRTATAGRLPSRSRRRSRRTIPLPARPRQALETQRDAAGFAERRRRHGLAEPRRARVHRCGRPAAAAGGACRASSAGPATAPASRRSGSMTSATARRRRCWPKASRWPSSANGSGHAGIAITASRTTPPSCPSC